MEATSSGASGPAQPHLLLFSSHHPISTHQSARNLQISAHQASRNGTFLAGLRKWWSNRKQGDVECFRSMVVSAGGKYIAVLDTLDITFLTTANGITKAIGSSRGSVETGIYTCGVWIDDMNIFVAATSCRCIVFLDLMGKELYKVYTKQWKAKGHVIGMFAKEMPHSTSSVRYRLMVLTSDCFLHQIGIGFEGLPKINPKDIRTVMHSSMTRMYPQGVVCSDYNSEKSILVLLGSSIASSISRSTGKYCLSVWRLAELWDSVELLGQYNDLEGFNPLPWISADTSKYMPPKLIMSPGINYIVLIDCRAKLQMFSLNEDPVWILQKMPSPLRCNVENSVLTAQGREACQLEATKMHTTNSAVSWHSNILYFEIASDLASANVQGEGALFETLNDIRDVCWWSEDALILLKKGGCFSVVVGHDLRIVSEFKISERCNKVHISHGLERRNIFVLEDILDHTAEGIRQSNEATSNLTAEHMETSGWRVISLEEHTVNELFTRLLDSAEFESALLLARRFNLDSEIVYKSRWLRSDYGLEALHQNLFAIGDRLWVLTECLEKVSPTVDAMNDLLQHGISVVKSSVGHRNLKDAAEDPSIGCFCVRWLRLLQYIDRLETFLGLSMGRYSSKDYEFFRSTPLQAIAISLAELGKTGALGLLYKRHVYSLTPHLFKILDSIPETTPPQKYSQLLPESNPPLTYITGREREWVEEEGILEVIKRYHGLYKDNCVVQLQDCTEYMVRLCNGFTWFSEDDINEWYRRRANIIDSVSGQLENSLSLLDLGKQKGLTGLGDLWEDVSTLYKAIYNDFDPGTEFHLSLLEWQQLGEYEKFQMILRGVNEVNVLDRLKEQAIPFLNRKYNRKGAFVNEQLRESLLVKWLKELAHQNQLQISAAVLAEACKGPGVSCLFETDIECIETGLDCIYSCTAVDQWDLMALILSKLSFISLQAQTSSAVELNSSGKSFARSFMRGTKLPATGRSTEVPSTIISTTPTLESGLGSLEKNKLYAALDRKIQHAADHVEAGRLLTQYQVPKPIGFFESAKNDEKAVKQLLHLLLSKFGRRQPARTDAEWAVMWQDMQTLQNKAFPFLNKQFLFLEYFRGLLKAGKFSLAKSQLKGYEKGSMIVERAEVVIIQAAREYFYSASSLESPEIDKSRLCLNILPESKNVATEMDFFDAVTLKLPALGVSLLPMQVRQVKDPMEIVKMALNSSSSKGDLKVDELLDVARLLGLNTSDHIAMVEEAIAREAAASGQIGLALNLCISLMKRGYGPIWDLCAALARGPELEGMTLKSQTELLGFALSYCDEESIGQLLYAWKEHDLFKRCTDLREVKSVSLPAEEKERWKHCDNLKCFEEKYRVGMKAQDDLKGMLERSRDILLKVTQPDAIHKDLDEHVFSKESKRLLDILCLQLPWLLQAGETECSGTADKEDNFEIQSGKEVTTLFKIANNLSPQSLAIILLGLAYCDLPPKDELICQLARIAMLKESKGGIDLMSCGYLLNLSDYRVAVDVFKQESQRKEELKKTCEIMKLALKYSYLLNSGANLNNPKQRKERLLRTLRNVNHTIVSGSTEESLQSSTESESVFWKDLQLKFLQKLHVAEQALELDKIIPNFNMDRFVSGEEEYVKHTVLSLVESAKTDEDNEIAQVSSVDRYQSSSSYLISVETGGVGHMKLNTLVLEEKYNSLKKYLKCLTINDQLAALQVLMHATSRAILENEKGNGFTGEQRVTSVSSLCWLLDFWVTGVEATLACTDKEVKDMASTQTMESLLDLKICCRRFEMLLHRRKVPGMQAQKVIAKVATPSTFEDQKALFLKAMISSGCSFQAVVEVWQGVCGEVEGSIDSEGRCVDRFGSKSDELMKSQLSVEAVDATANEPHSDLRQGSDFTQHTSNLGILEIYLQVINSSIDLCCDCYNATCLEDNFSKLEAAINAVASLYNIGGTDEEIQQEWYPAWKLLHDVRLGVWKTLCEFAENLDSPPFLRLCMLKLLEAIIGGQELADTVANFGTYLEKYTLSWVGWNVIEFSDDKVFPFPKIKNTVMALKSTELISAVWSDFEVKEENLVSVEAAKAFFFSLVDKVELPEHASILRRLLEEWVGIFGYEENMATEGSFETTTREDSTEKDNLWGHEDDWDDAWEETEPTAEKSESIVREAGVAVHVLHACWKIVIQKLAFYGRIEEILTLLDQVSLKNEKVLLTKEETIELVSSFAQESPQSAFKLSLLLPYVEAQNLALEFFDKQVRMLKSANLRQNKKPEVAGQELASEAKISSHSEAVMVVDYCLFTLVLASGHFLTIADDPKFSYTFSLFCAAMASSVQNAALLSTRASVNQTFKEESFLEEVIFPFFVASLTHTGRHAVASALVLQLMQVHPALITWNSAYAALKNFLFVKSSILAYGTLSTSSNILSTSSNNLKVGEGCLSCIFNTAHHLQSLLGDTLNSASRFLSKDSA